MIKNLLPTIKPHLWALLVFFGLTFAYFYPAFTGYKIKQGDSKNWMGMAQETVFHRTETGEQTLWTNSMFGGMPTYQISTLYTDFVLRAVDKVFTGFIPNNSRYFFLYLLGFYLMGLLLGWDQKVSILGAIAFAFSTYFIVILEAGHNSKAHAIGYMPLVFGSYVALWKNKEKWLYGGLFALFLGLELWCNHVQITYYLAMLIALFTLVKLVYQLKEGQKQNLISSLGVIVLAVTCAVMANSARLYNTYQYGKSTTRGGAVLDIDPNGNSTASNTTSGLDRDYVVQWSYGLQESFTLLIPNAKGGATSALGNNPDVLKDVPQNLRQSLAQSNGYWGNQAFTSGPVYLGAVVVLLFLFACVWVRGRLKWVLIATTLLALALSWGKNFMGLTNFFLDVFPGYNKFRAVTIILSLVEFTVPLLAFIGLQRLLSGKINWEENKKSYYIVSGISLGSLLILWLAPDSFFTFISDSEQAGIAQQAQGGNAAAVQNYVDALKNVRIGIFKKDAMRSLAFMIFTAALVQGMMRGWFKKSWQPVLALGILLVADLMPINKRYLGTEKVRGTYVSWEKKDQATVPAMPSRADEEIFNRELQANPSIQGLVNSALTQAQQSKGRLSQGEKAAVRFSTLNSNTNYRVLNMAKSTFNDSYTSFYHKSIGGYHGAKLRRYQDLIEFHFSGNLNFQVINMLNTKYIIQNQGGNLGVYPNPDAFGNAWFVRGLKEVEKPSDAILALKEGATNLRNIAVVNITDYPQYAGYNVGVDSSARISMTDYAPNKISYQSNTSDKQFAVFSEIYFQPGWQAYIDGVEAEHIRVNYLLRGMEIPAGQHEIVFEFAPKSYSVGNGINLAGSLLILALLAFGMLKNRNTLSESETVEGA